MNRKVMVSFLMEYDDTGHPVNVKVDPIPQINPQIRLALFVAFDVLQSLVAEDIKRLDGIDMMADPAVKH